MKRNSVRSLPASERPLNRLREVGERYVSTAELLALVIGGPAGLEIAYEMLATFEGAAGLAGASAVEMMRIDGVGEATAACIRAAMELGRRTLASLPEEADKITCPADAANLLMSDLAFAEQEEFWVIMLSTRNNILGRECIYRGNLNTSVIRTGEIFRPAIRNSAAAIILVHNHPSGDPSPSPEDVDVTKDIVKAGRLLNIEVLDHVIIGRMKFASMKERGVVFR